MQRVVFLVVIACEAGQREPVPAPQPAPAVPTDAVVALAADAVDAPAVDPMINHELVALQRKLGSAAVTCEGTATLLASQGEASPEKRRSRVERIRELCVTDRWPEAVRRCVGEASHDPLSCTSHLTTAKQQARWDVIFTSW